MYVMSMVNTEVVKGVYVPDLHPGGSDLTPTLDHQQSAFNVRMQVRKADFKNGDKFNANFRHTLAF